MKRQLIISSLCLVLLLLMMLSTTLAWFTDSKSNVNTMVAGKISIEQTETDENGQPFVGSNFVMMPSQTIVKKVTVENTGNQPAYVRTLFAFEDSADGMVLEMLETTGQNIEIPGVTETSVPKVQFTVTKTVDGKSVTTLYTVGYYVQPAALSHEDDKDDVVVLESITLDADADNEWHETVGKDYELFVLSQATQTAGLDKLGDNGAESPAAALNQAFAPITSENCAKWFAKVLGGTAVESAITINP